MTKTTRNPLLEPDPSRRRFIRQLTAGTVAASGLGSLAGCGGGGDDDDRATVRFDHGVASGDPQATRVVLWTRASPSQDVPLVIVWEVATDAGFQRIVQTGTVATDASHDFTVKVDVGGLAAGGAYHYRFRHGEGLQAVVSPAGRTRTLPDGGATRVKLAVFSCANYPAGYFNAYAAAALIGDLDATVHLGDYVYEYARGGYADADAASLGRESQPATETVRLADYRTRHAQYRTDPDLQALHAAAPMIAVWDDHEVANDTWRGGAENHQPAQDGDFFTRRAAAVQAYHEWMPTRLPDAANPLRIYRSFDFGGLVSLHMLDTRLVGRDEQLSLQSYLRSDGSFDGTSFSADVGAASRQLIGTAQAQWLQQQLQASTATWQVLGQQVLMGRMQVPSPILFNLLSGGNQGVSLSAYAALVQKAQTAPGTLTAQEQAVLSQPALPYNLDAWDGYAAARETVLGMARTMDKNLVVLSGDTHNAWANDLDTLEGDRAGVEFATPSVSSPGFEAYLPDVDPVQLAGALQQLIGPLQWADTHRRGFMVVTATAGECRADWHMVSTVRSRNATAEVARSLRTRPGSGHRRIVEV